MLGEATGPEPGSDLDLSRAAAAGGAGAARAVRLDAGDRRRRDRARHRVLPDGCADLVWIGEAPAVVAGPATGPVLVPLAPRTMVVGVRLRPGAAPALLGLPASELGIATRRCGSSGAPRARRSPTGSSRSPRRGQARRGRSGARPRASPRRPARSPDRRRDRAGSPAIRAAGSRISPASWTSGARRLHRRFMAAVGYGPKTFQRVLRLQRVLALAGRARRPERASPRSPPAAGYADQAHMSRELQALTGRARAPCCGTRRSTLELSDLFKTGARPAA